MLTWGAQVSERRDQRLLLINPVNQSNSETMRSGSDFGTYFSLPLAGASQRRFDLEGIAALVSRDNHVSAFTADFP